MCGSECPLSAGVRFVMATQVRRWVGVASGGCTFSQLWCACGTQPLLPPSHAVVILELGPGLSLRLSALAGGGEGFGKLSVCRQAKRNSRVVSFVEREGVDDYYQMTEGERKRVTFAFVCKVSKAEREEGNQLFNTNMIQRALAKYKRAAKILDDYHLKTDEEEAEQKKLLVKVYSNIALCCLRLKQNGTCITWCHKVIELDPSNVKAYFRKGQALHSMSEFENARTMYRKAQRLNEFSQEIIEALSKLEQDIKKFRIQSEDYRRMCQRMVSLSASDDSRTAPDNRESQRESSDPEEECSARFRETVIEKLEEFKSDAEMTEMPFPEQSLTVPEIACIVEVAGILGLNIQRHGAGNASRMVVVKSKQQLQF